MRHLKHTILLLIISVPAYGERETSNKVPDFVIEREPNKVALKHVSLEENSRFVPYVEADHSNNPRYYLEGRIINNQKRNTVNRFSVKIVYEDCLEAQCIIVGRDEFLFDKDWIVESSHNDGVPVPPGESRNFRRGVKAIPAVRGELMYSYELEYPTQPMRL